MPDQIYSVRWGCGCVTEWNGAFQPVPAFLRERNRRPLYGLEREGVWNTIATYDRDNEGALEMWAEEGVVLNFTRDHDGRITQLTGAAGADCVYDDVRRQVISDTFL